jgi:hypothetical protein
VTSSDAYGLIVEGVRVHQQTAFGSRADSTYGKMR